MQPQQNVSSSASYCSQFSLIPEWDHPPQPLTNEDLAAIDAIEAAFQPSTNKKRQLPPQNNGDYDGGCLHKARRRLPNSFSLSPCRGNVKMRYPAFKFGGKVLYSRTAADVEKAAMEFLKMLECKRVDTGFVTVGFDIEWKPTFRKGVSPGKAAVMQLCSGTDHCHVMHIIHSGIPKSLRFLLEDSTLLKVGVGIGGDSGKIFKDYNVSVKAVEDLSYLAKKKIRGELNSWGLQSLIEMFVCKELHKPNKIRLGNWEADVLSKEQLEYAATDAFASWQLYQVLRSLPDVKNEADERSEELEVVP